MGYKDAVIKYYVSNMLENQDLELDGDYEVDDNNTGQLIDAKGKEYQFQILGTISSGGYISIENNDITK